MPKKNEKDKQIEKLKKDLKYVRKRLIEANEWCGLHVKRIGKLEKKLDEKEKELERYGKGLVKLDKAGKEVTDEWFKLTQLNSKLSKENESLKARVEALKKELNKHKEVLAKLEDDLFKKRELEHKAHGCSEFYGGIEWCRNRFEIIKQELKGK